MGRGGGEGEAAAGSGSPEDSARLGIERDVCLCLKFDGGGSIGIVLLVLWEVCRVGLAVPCRAVSAASA